MKKKLIARVIVASCYLMFAKLVSARSCHLPTDWEKLCPILESRVSQTKKKMQLLETSAIDLENFLQTSTANFSALQTLQSMLPKTTIELLISTNKRGIPQEEINLMASYLEKLLKHYKFQNIAAFDENTSHIIGKEWHEIDYSGEGMTWQKQQAKYASYAITNFKSVKNLQNFFPVEEKLPYFAKIYKPQIKIITNN